MPPLAGSDRCSAVPIVVPVQCLEQRIRCSTNESIMYEGTKVEHSGLGTSSHSHSCANHTHNRGLGLRAYHIGNAHFDTHHRFCDLYMMDCYAHTHPQGRSYHTDEARTRAWIEMAEQAQLPTNDAAESHYLVQLDPWRVACVLAW